MKTQIDLKDILKKGFISDEIELERVLILDRKLRLLVLKQPELAESRKTLRSIIKEYERKNWGNDEDITDEKVRESDIAEFIAEQERAFLLKRKNTIKEKLIKSGLRQQELALILGHSKSYMSELMNGINSFSNKDLIIIHRLFDIKLEYLIPTFIPQVESRRIRESIQKIKKPNLKLHKRDLVLVR